MLIKPGLILTALHVVEPWKFVFPDWDGVVEQFAIRPEYDVLEVQFPGQQPLKASVVAVSAEHDLAILQVQQTSSGPVPLGQTNAEVKVTDEIAILGYPGNLGQYQVQVQNVTGFGGATREITEVTPTFIHGTVAQPLTGAGEASHHLAFNAAIEPGNSGGPVVNRNGQVIGIVSFQFDRSGPPINILGQEVATQLPSQVGSRAVWKNRPKRRTRSLPTRRWRFPWRHRSRRARRRPRPWRRGRRSRPARPSASASPKQARASARASPGSCA